MDKNIKQYEDLIEAEDSTLLLANIESIVYNENTKKYFENKYGSELYSEILLVLTHEKFDNEDAEYLWGDIKGHLSAITKKLDRNPGIVVATLDYLSNIHKSLSSPVLIEEDKSDFISKATTTDELTQLYMRSIFDITLEKEFEESLRTKKNNSLLMIDIDDFKKVNDKYGHTQGDEVLRKVGEIINNSVRKMDVASRYGGEEIAIILPDSTLKEAQTLAERIRKRISNINFSDFTVTVSIGISKTTSDMKNMLELVNEADEALYDAKRRGKNQVVVYNQKRKTT